MGIFLPQNPHLSDCTPFSSVVLLLKNMKKENFTLKHDFLTALRTLAVEEAPFTFEASYTGDVVGKHFGWY